MIKVKDIMRSYVIVTDKNTTIDEIAKIMTKNRIGSVIIVDDKQRPIGIVTDSDIIGAIANDMDPKKTKAYSILSKRFITTGPNEDVLKVTKKMIKNGIKRLPVIDKGRLIGIVSDKEILLTAPEMIEILSEKLKARVERISNPIGSISGICENCGGYSDNLKEENGKWVCEDCSES